MVDRVFSFRFLSLLVALGLYAFASSPTPDNPGLIEIIIGLLLCIVAISGAWTMVLHVKEMRNLWQSSGMVLMIYGLSVPLCLGLAYGQDTGLILRDMLPFLFMGFALFASDIFVGEPYRFKIFLWAVVGVGLVQAARSLLPIYDFLIFDFSGVSELYYFANSPFVLLAALMCLAAMVKFFMAGRYPLILLLGLLIVVPLAAMVFTLQRASLGYVAVFVCALLGLAMINRPSRGIWLLAALGVGLMFVGGQIWSVFDALLQKTQSHGFNMRVEEWRSVWALASGSWWALLFGQGWGMSFESPAVSGVRVNFTHSLFSSMVLKTGLVGAALAFAYLVGLAQILWVQFQRNQVLALVLAGPFLIDVLLYATFKSLDFGLLLLLIPASIVAGSAPILESQRPVG